MRTGILIVDPQNDFFPGGALGVKYADKIIEPILNLLKLFTGAPIFVSQDWHRPESKHFKDNGGTWPMHCLAGTEGADIRKEIFEMFDTDARCNVVGFFAKGTMLEDDGYSAFEGATDEGETLSQALTVQNVNKLIICGLATDHCVKASALDAVKHNKNAETYLYTKGIRAINPSDGIKAIEEMMSAGVKLL